MSKKMSTDTNAINWFEIPVVDMDKARKFYESIFDVTMNPVEMMGMRMAFFPPTGANGTVGGGLVQSPLHTPSSIGAKLYLNANPDLQLVLDKIPSNGGMVHMEKTKISDEDGYMAFFSDTEGNVIGLHSNA